MKLATVLSGSVATLALFLASAQVSRADLIKYPAFRTINPITYSFTATNTGDLTAYFAGSSAGYSESVGVLVNGVSTGVFGLNNHTSAIGESLNFGPVVAGDSVVIVDKISGGNTWYSNAAMNGDSMNHIFSTSFSGTLGTQIISGGTFVSFEDETRGQSDLDYNDTSLVFSGLADPPGGAPEPDMLPVLAAGLFGIGLIVARRHRLTA